MNIGIILISRGFSGAESVIYNIVSILSKNKKNKICLLVNDEIYLHYTSLRSVNVFNVGYIGDSNFFLKSVNFYKVIRNIRKIIKRNKLQVVNSHMDLSNLVSPRIPRHINVFHGTDFEYFLKPPSLKYRLVIFPKLNLNLNRSLKIVFVSKRNLEKLPDKYRNKAFIIPNGVNSNIFRPLTNTLQKNNIILFAGRFIDIKGIQEIVNVAKQLPQYEFWFAGQGPLEKLINLSNTKNLGFKSTEELVNLYNQATICIFPSYRESFGLVGLEAMSCGRAVIATPLGFSEYIENGKDGIIIPAKDEKALKNAIVDLMTNEKKRKMLEKNARKKALQYSWDKVAKQYMKVFEEVLKENEAKN